MRAGIRNAERALADFLMGSRFFVFCAARIAGLTGIYVRTDGSLAFVFAARVGLDEHPRGPRHEIRKQKWVPADQALRRLSASSAERLRDALGHPRVFRRRAARVVGPRTLRVSAG